VEQALGPGHRRRRQPARLGRELVDHERRDPDRRRQLALAQPGRAPGVELPDLADEAGQHRDHAQRALPLVAQRRHRGQRAGEIARADPIGQLEDRALAGVGDQVLDVVGGDRAAAGVDRELVDDQGQARQVVADRVGQPGHRAAVDPHAAGLGLAADPRGRVARGVEDVEEALLVGGRVQLDPLVELRGHRDQHRRRARRGQVVDQAGQLGRRQGREVADEDHPARRHHRQGLGRRHDPAGRRLALEDVVVERAPLRRHRGVADRGHRAIDQHRVIRREHVDRRQASGRGVARDLLQVRHRRVYTIAA